jgi:hypothetical protein
MARLVMTDNINSQRLIKDLGPASGPPKIHWAESGIAPIAEADRQPDSHG